MGQGRMRRASVLVAAAALTAALWPAAPAGAAPTWAVQKSTNRGGVANTLNDVSCATAARCVAVGAYRDFRLPPAGPSGTLIETWANGKWTTNASPGQGGASRLNSVSCPTATRCYAVGESHSSTAPLMVTSGGGAWSQVTPPVGADPGGLHGIDCWDATHCVAVGTRGPYGSGLLAIVLDGTTWSVATLPDVGEGLLYDVSCATATSCVAVGYRVGTSGAGRSLILHLANGTWSKVAVANRTTNDNRLHGVSCTATSRCTAVGSYATAAGPRRAIRATWSANAWTLSPGSVPGMWFSVDCTVASVCTMAGQTNTGAIVEQVAFNSASGIVFGTPSSFAGVDCVTKNVCVAVGQIATADPFRARTFVIRSR